MTKQILLITFALILLISINLVSAEIQFWQQKMDMGNGTIKNHIVVLYSKGGFGGDDYVSANNPYEVYLLYNIYVKKFNEANPHYQVNKCDWQIRFLGYLENSSTLLVNQTFTEADNDIMSAKYFIQLNDGDGFIADQICYFADTTQTGLNIPAEMQLVTTSWECKACQFYEWSLQERDIAKAKAIGDNVVSVSGYIKKLFMLNFEIWLALFWFFLIFMVFASISFVFIGIYWLYLYLRRVMR